MKLGPTASRQDVKKKSKESNRCVKVYKPSVYLSTLSVFLHFLAVQYAFRCEQASLIKSTNSCDNCHIHIYIYLYIIWSNNNINNINNNTNNNRGNSFLHFVSMYKKKRRTFLKKRRYQKSQYMRYFFLRYNTYTGQKGGRGIIHAYKQAQTRTRLPSYARDIIVAYFVRA